MIQFVFDTPIYICLDDYAAYNSFRVGDIIRCNNFEKAKITEIFVQNRFQRWWNRYQWWGIRFPHDYIKAEYIK